MKYSFIILTLLYVVSCGPVPHQPKTIQSSSIEALYEGLEFDMPLIAEPVIPDLEKSIAEFGAVPDGITKNTEAFAATIQNVSAAGGGKVIVPRGMWLTGPITLKSNINLHLEAGALIIFTDDKDDYPIVETSFEGLNTFRCQSPINGRDLENIAITGSGTIDGNGGAWRMVKKEKMTEPQWKKLLKSGGVTSDDGKVWYPSEQFKRGAEFTANFNVPDPSQVNFEEIRDFLRPVMVSLINCKNVLLDGPTFQNSPAWNLHPLMCENVIIRNLSVRNPWYSQNGDGLDLESCKNVLIYDNTFDVGDDGICIKSGKDKDGRDRAVPTENVIIKNNIVYHGHGGFTVGSEMSSGVKNIHVSNCTFMGTDVGLRFKSTRGRGGVVENIYISNIDMIDIPTDPIRFNLFYGGQSPILEEDQEAAVADPEKEPVTEETPSFRDIYMKNIRAVRSGSAGYFQGLPEMKLKNIQIEDSYLEGKTGISMIDANDITFKNVKIQSAEGYPLTLYNTTNFVSPGLELIAPDATKGLLILGAESQNIDLTDSNIDPSAVKIDQKVNSESVKL